MILPMALAEEEEDNGWELSWPVVSSEEEEDVEWMPEEDVETEVGGEVGNGVRPVQSLLLYPTTS